MDTDDFRAVVMLPSANPHVVRFRPMTTDLAHVIGRFTPARYDRNQHAYEVSADLAGQLATFLRAHAVEVINAPLPEQVERYPASADTLAIVRESQERASHPDEQAATNQRGIDLVRIMASMAASQPPHVLDVDTGQRTEVATCRQCWTGHHDKCAGTHDHRCCCGQTVRLRR